MSSVHLEPIGDVSSPRTEPLDDGRDAITSTVTLDAARFTEQALRGLDELSHIEVVYVFDRVPPARSSRTPVTRAATRRGRRWASSPSVRRRARTGSA